MKKLHSFALYALATPFITLSTGSVLAQTTTQEMDRQQQTAPRDQGATPTTPKSSTGSSTTQRDQGAMPSSPSTSQGSSSSQRDQGAMPSSPSTSQGSSSSQRNQGAMPSSPSTSQGSPSTPHDKDAMKAAPKTGAQDAPRAGQSGSQSAVENKNTTGALTQNRGFMSSAPARAMQANNLIGAEVKTSGDVDVGPVSDLIIDDKGHVVAIVVSVGGFLGMGEREVAIGWDDVTRSASSAASSDEPVLQISSTREELLAAPEYKKANKSANASDANNAAKANANKANNADKADKAGLK